MNITMTFVLTGFYAGKDVSLGSKPYRFTKGELTLTDTPVNLKMEAQFLERNWQAYPEGDPRLGDSDGKRGIQEDKQSPLSSDLQPNGKGVATGQSEAILRGGTDETEAGNTEPLPDGDGPTQGINIKLQKAVFRLDHKNDSHWTKDGSPSLAAVSNFYGATDIKRRDIEVVAPGFKRPKGEDNEPV